MSSIPIASPDAARVAAHDLAAAFASRLEACLLRQKRFTGTQPDGQEMAAGEIRQLVHAVAARIEEYLIREPASVRPSH